MLVVKALEVGRWKMPAVVFEAEDLNVAFAAIGIVGNSIPTSASGKARLSEWKATVAAAAKAGRGSRPLSTEWTYAVSAGFSFNQAAHGSQTLDVENFLKPTFDALAAGLFCSPAQDPRAIPRYNFDDSGFRYLFAHRLPDATDARDEGVGIVVSVQKQATRLGV